MGEGGAVASGVGRGSSVNVRLEPAGDSSRAGWQDTITAAITASKTSEAGPVKRLLIMFIIILPFLAYIKEG